MNQPFTFQRYGGYECSSAGDRRFSAFCALMPDGRTIEMHYQCDVKGYQPGGKNWRLGKGKRPLNNLSFTEQWNAYLALWRTWASYNPSALEDLAHKATLHGNRVLSDRFASSAINQARALATILNEHRA